MPFVTVYHNVNETQTHVKDYGLSIFYSKLILLTERGLF